MPLLASALDEAGARPWIWLVLAGLVLGGSLVAHAGLMIVRALPDAVRARGVRAVRARPRLAAVSGAVAAWTLVYALYSLAYPSGAVLADAAARRGTEVAGAGLDQVPTPPLRGSAPAFDGMASGGSGTGAEVLPGAGERDDSAAGRSGGTGTQAPPGSGSGPETPPPPPAPPTPCPVVAAAEAVRDAQEAIEGSAGRPLGADGGAFVEALAGCKDPTMAALSLLGPLNQLLKDAGVPMLDLPAIPEVAFPVVPELIAAPMRPAVFEVCGQILSEAYTVASVAPVFRVEFTDAVAVIEIVARACTSFAPRSGA